MDLLYTALILLQFNWYIICAPLDCKCMLIRYQWLSHQTWILVQEGTPLLTPILINDNDRSTTNNDSSSRCTYLGTAWLLSATRALTPRQSFPRWAARNHLPRRHHNPHHHRTLEGWVNRHHPLLLEKRNWSIYLWFTTTINSQKFGTLFQ